MPGLIFGPNLALSMKDSCTGVVGAVRAQAREAYDRSLCLFQRTRYVQLCLLAKIWYVAQFPPQNPHTFSASHEHLLMVNPITTLQRPKHERGWDLPNFEVKCKSLFAT